MLRHIGQETRRASVAAYIINNLGDNREFKANKEACLCFLASYANIISFELFRIFEYQIACLEFSSEGIGYFATFLAERCMLFLEKIENEFPSNAFLKGAVKEMEHKSVPKQYRKPLKTKQNVTIWFPNELCNRVGIQFKNEEGFVYYKQGNDDDGVRTYGCRMPIHFSEMRDGKKIYKLEEVSTDRKKMHDRTLEDHQGFSTRYHVAFKHDVEKYMRERNMRERNEKKSSFHASSNIACSTFNDFFFQKRIF